MSPFPAVCRNGVCTGSLWKSHTRARGGTSPLPMHGNNALGQKNAAVENAMSFLGAASSAAISLDGILAEANERQRSHEFCVLIGNTLWSYSDVWAYGKGDPPTSEIRIVGASAWNPSSATKKPIPRSKPSSPPAVSATSNAALEAETTHPPHSISNASTSGSSKSADFLLVTYAGTHVRCSAPSPLDKDEWLVALHAGLEGSFPESRVEALVVLSKRYDKISFNGEQYRSMKSNLFRADAEENDAVNRENHVNNGNDADTPRTKSETLVEAAISNAMAAFEAETTFRLLVPPPPQIEAKNARLARRSMSKSSSTADLDASHSSSYIYSGYGNSLGDVSTSISSAHPPTTGYSSPCDDWSVPPSESHCTACGLYPPEHALRIDAAPLPEYGMEVRVDLCHNCWIAQGVLRHVRYLGGLYEAEARERAAIRMAWDEVKAAIDLFQTESAPETIGVVKRYVQDQHSCGTVTTSTNLLSRDKQYETQSVPGEVAPSKVKQESETEEVISTVLANPERGTERKMKTLMPSPLSQATTNDAAFTAVLLNTIHTTKFAAFRRQSKALDLLCQPLEANGRGCASEFLENIVECAQAAESSCLYGIKQELDGNDEEISHSKQRIGMKKEAFKVAGDMGSALRLMYEYALPSDHGNLPSKSRVPSSNVGGNADMLAAILEFFLDLCDEGELEAVAFFWPQLCHIHMQMLPPRDTVDLIRVELMEDFLLTVSTRYSVHLALSLVWGLTADLEESLSATNCNAASRRRRFAVLRFVSELESLLFDFDGGWGGGGVSLHGMLSPSQHQAVLLRDAMSLLQLHRRFGAHYLTRSVRLEKLRAEALESIGERPSSIDRGSKVRTQIAKNADYFSSHIALTRKLGDIAEKLRFMELDKRSEALRQDLKEINSSGRKLGGDPLNRLCGDGRLYSLVHIPINEGHVFRSKERTPVLLLTELIKDDPSEVASEQAELPAKASSSEVVVDVMFENQPIGRDLGNLDKTPLLVSFGEECTSDDQVMSSAGDDSSHASFVSVQKGSLLYPPSPSSTQSKVLEPSAESAGKLPHGVLSLTPRASEATHVTEEGKEMMADMIANLIENQRNNLMAPILDDKINIRNENDHTDPGHPHQQSVILENRGERPEESTEDLFIRSLSAVEGCSPSFPRQENLARSSSTLKREYGRKISALGSVFPQPGKQGVSSDPSKIPGVHLTADGQFRRDVLFAIMEKGMRGNNVIARGAATAARRAVQAMDRKRAIALMNEPNASEQNLSDSYPKEICARPGSELNKQNNSEIVINASIDEDEALEALRLLIIQNRVAQENLSSENAVKSGRNYTDLSEDINSGDSDQNQREVDAGEVDPRLAGCGRISSSVLSALRLWKGGIVSNGELLELVQKDLQFLKQSAAFGAADENKLIEDSAFWGRFSFGERWAEKKARLAASSPHGALLGWDLIGCIVKSNDDLRQEAFVMQLIDLCAEAFQMAGLDLWVHPYEIVATGRSTGIIECVRNAMSFDSLKKRPGYGSEGLAGHFKRMTEIAADPFKALKEAKQNFVSSLAAYSLMSYLFMFKDRHNGNLLLDTAGHVIHIDFGFVFGIAPGGSFSLEQSTPFKLTDEMLDVMGGLGSPLFSEFVTLFCCGFLALQAHTDTFLTVVEITCRGSNFHCFDGKDSEEIVSKLRERFCPQLNKAQTVAYALDLIKFATTSYGTKQYDYFQYLSQGIAT